jgi:hypothetical protein
MEDTIIIELLQNQDIDKVNHFYNTIYNSNRTRAEFEWEFIHTPLMKAIYVVAKDKNTGQIVGTQCAIPCHLKIAEGSLILSAKSEDTLVDPKYRGKKIFEKMYALLFTECKQNGINYIWGFTYATKPFSNVGFEIPFSANIGIIAISIAKSYNYLKSLNKKNSFIDKFKILGLSCLSKLNYIRHLLNTHKGFNGYIFNKLVVDDLTTLLDEILKDNRDLFYILQDKEFLRWRIFANPYNLKFHQSSLNDNKNNLVANIIYSIDTNGVAYIIQQLFAESVTKEIKQAFLAKIFTEIKKEAFIIRYWAFTINRYMINDKLLLESTGFTFINRGISFVWKDIDNQNIINPKNLIISRMASQGTN